MKSQPVDQIDGAFSESEAEGVRRVVSVLGNERTGALFAEARARAGYTLQLPRFTFAPGSTIAPHSHAGAQAGWVASGDLAITRLGGLDAVLHRAPSNGVPGPAEPLALGVETVLHTRDALFDPGSQHWVRNTGSTPCVIYVSALYKDGEKGATFINAQGTPAP